jgi:hypothetical protein
LKPGIVPAKVCSFIDYNLNKELNKFTTQNGDVVHNGAPINVGLLNEKWESFALVPVNEEKGGCDIKDEYYLITISDNDFVTNNGMLSRSSTRGTIEL